MLREFLAAQREEILARARLRVAGEKGTGRDGGRADARAARDSSIKLRRGAASSSSQRSGRPRRDPGERAAGTERISSAGASPWRRWSTTTGTSARSSRRSPSSRTSPIAADDFSRAQPLPRRRHRRRRDRVRRVSATRRSPTREPSASASSPTRCATCSAPRCSPSRASRRAPRGRGRHGRGPRPEPDGTAEARRALSRRRAPRRGDPERRARPGLRSSSKRWRSARRCWRRSGSVTLLGDVGRSHGRRAGGPADPRRHGLQPAAERFKFRAAHARLGSACGASATSTRVLIEVEDGMRSASRPAGCEDSYDRSSNGRPQTHRLGAGTLDVASEPVKAIDGELHILICGQGLRLHDRSAAPAAHVDSCAPRKPEATER